MEKNEVTQTRWNILKVRVTNTIIERGDGERGRGGGEDDEVEEGAERLQNHREEGSGTSDRDHEVRYVPGIAEHALLPIASCSGRDLMALLRTLGDDDDMERQVRSQTVDE